MYNICMGKFWTILSSGKVRIGIIDSNDHNPPHVHVKAPGAKAKINILDSRIVSSKGFSKQSLKELQKSVKDQKEMLLEKWEEFYGKED